VLKNLDKLVGFMANLTKLANQIGNLVNMLLNYNPLSFFIY